MGKILKSPAPLAPQTNRSVFLAGGISNCADWQEPVAQRIAAETDALIYNPRRQDFDMSAYEDISRAQIRWEYFALRSSSVNLFWFPKETLCPITLMEYGSAMERLHPGALMCGADPKYARRFDLIEQTNLKQHNGIFSELNDLVSETILLLNSLPG